MSIPEIMEQEYARRKANKEYGGYFYYIQNDKIVGKEKNTATAVFYALVGAFVSNTAQNDQNIGNNFTPTNYNDSSAPYTITYIDSFTLMGAIQTNIATQPYYTSAPPAVTVTANYLNIIMSFGVLDSSVTSGTITQIYIRILDTGTSDNEIFLTTPSNTQIPFNPSVALTITYQLIV